MLSDLGEALGGFRLKADGSLETVDENPAGRIERVKTLMGGP